MQIIFILNFDTINYGEEGSGVGDGSGERYHPVALNCLQNFLVLLWIMVKLTAVRMIAKKCAITLLREATRKQRRHNACCLLVLRPTPAPGVTQGCWHHQKRLYQPLVLGYWCGNCTSNRVLVPQHRRIHHGIQLCHQDLHLCCKCLQTK